MITKIKGLYEYCQSMKALNPPRNAHCPYSETVHSEDAIHCFHPCPQTYHPTFLYAVVLTLLTTITTPKDDPDQGD